MKKMWLVFAVLLSGLSPQFAHADAPAVRQSTQASISYGVGALQKIRQDHSELFQNGQGVLVVGVVIGSQADAAGIRISDVTKEEVGDVIVSYASQPIDTAKSFVTAVSKYSSTKGNLDMVVIRANTKIVVKLASGRVGVQLLDVASLDGGSSPGTETEAAEADDKPLIFAQLGLPTGCLAISSDGRFALTGSENAVKLWEISSGREIRTFSGHAGNVVSVAFSPNGRYALSGSMDGVLKLWEITTGNAIHSLRAHSQTLDLLPVAFSPDGRQAFSGGMDGKIILWDLVTGAQIRTMTDKGPISSLAFSPDGRQALSSSSFLNPGFFVTKIQSDLKLWDVATGQLLRTMEGHSAVLNSSIRSVSFSPDGRRALSASFDETVKLWDLASGQEIRSMAHPLSVSSVVFSPDGKRALSTADKMYLWDLESGKVISALGSNITRAVFSPDGHQALGLSNALETFDIATGKLIRRFDGNSPWEVPTATAFSPDGRRIVSGGKAAEIWDITTGRRILRVPEENTNNGITSIVFSPDGSKMLSGHLDNSLKLRDTGTGVLIRSFKGHSGYVKSVAISRDGGRALSSGSDYIGSLKGINHDGLRLWDIATGETIRTLEHHLAHSVALSPDGKQALSASAGGTILWDISSGKSIRTFDGSTWTAAFSPDGRYALVSYIDPNRWPTIRGRFEALGISENFKVRTGTANTLRLLDLRTGLKVHDFSGHTGDVRSVAFSPDGTRALSGSMDNTMKLWDVATGKEIRTFVGHMGHVDSVSFSPDGRLALSGGRDSSTRIWEVDTGREIIQMVGFEDGEWISITPDGYYNASPNGDKYLNVRIGNKVYGIENYREAFFRPDLVKIALSGGSLKGYRNIAEVKTPPQVDIVDTPLTVAGDELTVMLKLSDTGGGIGDVRLYLNGSAIMLDNTRGIKVVEKENKKGTTRSYNIRLARGDNIIRAVAFNADNSMQSNPAEQTVTAAFTPSAKPTLHALVIGINEYKNPKLRLQYAVPDADLFTETLKKGATELFGKVNVVRLTTPAQTTSENITNELKKMRSINPDDMFILFVAGHGTVDDGEYFLITSNVGSTSTAKLKTDALSQDRIKALIANIPTTKKVIILDTCNAGQMGDAIQVALLTRGMSEDTAFKILSRAVGSTILSSATSAQEALEGYQGHGLFTWVLAEGMKGKADKGKSGYIKTTDLVDYVESEVPEIAEKHFKRKQYPTTAVSGQGFPIGKTGL